MSRWKPKRRRPEPFALGVSVEQGTPGELQELAALVALKGPGMLAGRDPAKVGLLAVHPRSPACPDDMRDEQSACLTVAPRAELERIARNSLRHPPGPGVFWAILLGENKLLGLHLGPMGSERA